MRCRFAGIDKREGSQLHTCISQKRVGAAPNTSTQAAALGGGVSALQSGRRVRNMTSAHGVRRATTRQRQ